MRIQFVGESTFGRGEYSLKVRVQLVGESTVGSQRTVSRRDDSW